MSDDSFMLKPIKDILNKSFNIIEQVFYLLLAPAISPLIFRYIETLIQNVLNGF